MVDFVVIKGITMTENKRMNEDSATKRYFKLEFHGTGSEVVVGKITAEEFEHLAAETDEEGYSVAVPDQWSEMDDLLHTHGVELNWDDAVNLMRIIETDEEGTEIKKVDFAGIVDNGFNLVLELDIPDSMDYKSFYSVIQTYEKGLWYTEQLIETDSAGLDYKKLLLKYKDIEDLAILDCIEYDGEERCITSDTRTNSTAIRVFCGLDNCV